MTNYLLKKVKFSGECVDIYIERDNVSFRVESQI